MARKVVMDIEMLANWHREQFDKVKHCFDDAEKTNAKYCNQLEFHLNAARLIESFSSKHREQLLAETEREVKLRAVESLEKLTKLLAVETKDLRRMLADDVIEDA